MQVDLHAKTEEIAFNAEECIRPAFERIERNALVNTNKVLKAFRENRVSESCFAGTTGYGYDDQGRDTLDRIYADVFGAEDALVRVQFVNGTHAISSALYGVLRPGDTLCCTTGLPYDTIRGIIGIDGKTHPGNLRFYGIDSFAVPLLSDGSPDEISIAAAVKQPAVRAALIQRSRGYDNRPALSVETIARLIDIIHKANPDVLTVVDNCYGEFTETVEPAAYGADLMAGSLIKNPGGGLAMAGGYVAGKKEWVESTAYRLTVPGIGRECGSSLGQNRSLYQGFFLAPHIVSQALKTGLFAAAMMHALGFRVDPLPEDERHDIIQTVIFGNPEPMLKFISCIQYSSPVDAFVTPEPWAMPGYDDAVVMAAGTFIQGSSIELSADGPMRAPYTAYLQGGLTYESGKIGILSAAEKILEWKAGGIV